MLKIGENVDTEPQRKIELVGIHGRLGMFEAKYEFRDIQMWVFNEEDHTKKFWVKLMIFQEIVRMVLDICNSLKSLISCTKLKLNLIKLVSSSNLLPSLSLRGDVNHYRMVKYAEYSFCLLYYLALFKFRFCVFVFPFLSFWSVSIYSLGFHFGMVMKMIQIE
jgi:hypothetical protein